MPGINGQPNQVSSFQLKLSYWYVTHKLQLKKGLSILLIFFSIILYSYSIYRAAMILLVEDQGFKQDISLLSTDLIDYSSLRQINQPKELEILGFDTIGGKDDRYDFVALIRNSNSQWVARQVTLQLLVGQTVVAEKNSFIYPGEDKYIAFFGQKVSGYNNPVLNIAQVTWRRYRDFEELAGPRLKFEVSDIKFSSAKESGIRGDLPVSRLTFKITNASAYSYWQVGVYMILFSGGRPIGANYTSLDQFRSNEARDVDMRWYESLPSVNQVEVLPEVDILSPGSFMPVE